MGPGDWAMLARLDRGDAAGVLNDGVEGAAGDLPLAAGDLPQLAG